MPISNDDDYFMDGTDLDLDSLNIAKVEILDDEGNAMVDTNGKKLGGFRYTKNKGNYYQCRMCLLFSINQNNGKLCINPECESNVVVPRTPGEMTTKSVVNVGRVMSHQKSQVKKVTVKGKEFERGQIPSFETVKFADVHKLIFMAQEEHRFLFIVDLTGKVGTACEYSTYQFFSFHGEHKKYMIAKKQTLDDSIECLRRS